jgi:(p)ppGpp synthase/HD superfamily hydrolase
MAQLAEILTEGKIMDWVHAVKANAYATYQHRGQVRKFSGAAYVKHPRRVANRIKRFGVSDPDIIAAAYLHDVIEDTPVSYDDVKRHFNKKVADLVREVSTTGGKTSFISKLMKNGSEGAVIIKVFDRIDNLNDRPNLEKARTTTEIIRSGLKKRGFSKLYNEFMKTYNTVYA